MKFKIILTTVLIGIVSLALSQPSKTDRQALHKEIKQYVDQNVIHVIKPQREQLDTYLSQTEKSEIEDIRTQMEAKRKEMKGKRGEFKGPRQSGEKPTEAQMEALRAQRNEYRKLMMQAWAIADNHEKEIEQLISEIRPNSETWRKDLKAIAEKYRPEDAPQKHQKGDRPGRREGMRHHQGKNGHRGGPAGFGRFMQPVGFLLWDTSKELGVLDESPEIRTFPNPTQAASNLEYQVSQTGKVTVSLLNDKGLVIKTLVDEVKDPGSYTIKTDLSELDKGMYFYQIKTPEGVQTKKIIIEE